MSKHKCCVVNCNSISKDVSLHCFPKTEIGLQKWLECIGCENLRGLSELQLRRLRVCRKHFEKRFHGSVRTKSRLRVGAYPTLFSESEIASGNAQTPDKYQTNTGNSDHSYANKRKLHLDDHTYYKKDQKRLCTVIDAGTPRKLIKRKRLFNKVGALTPRCSKLYKLYTKSRKQLDFRERAKNAVKFTKDTAFDKLTEKMNPITKKILWMQISQCTKKSNGRRFSDDEKIIALAIMKQSPKCYRFLHKLFILPSRNTLNKMISKLNIEAGINTQIFDALKQEVATWTETKRYCSIIFDEVALEAGLTFDSNKDVIDGFIDLDERKNEFADHALVFMIRGAVNTWQQPTAYYLCKGATSGVQLKILLKKVITAVSSTGLIPIALISDQGTAFQSALKSLQF